MILTGSFIEKDIILTRDIIHNSQKEKYETEHLLPTYETTYHLGKIAISNPVVQGSMCVCIYVSELCRPSMTRLKGKNGRNHISL